LKEVTLDTDTTVQTVYGRQMGARKGYNPQHRGKKSYQPILTFLAETREYVGGELRKGLLAATVPVLGTARFTPLTTAPTPLSST
jgi:hypothetical protein